MTRCQHCGAENADGARFCGACGRAVSATEPSSAGGMRALGAAPDLVGREIGGRFRILAKLGEGGMGAVYRGEQMSLKRKVAIKLLHPELSADPSLVRRFNAEAELVAKLSHPSTVNIYDFGQDSDGTLFIAMEFLEGRSLRQVVGTEGPLPVLRALHIAGQIAASIADAHRHGIVHRDLKPDNVMLIERGREKDVVRVLDFGIAKLRDEQKQTINPMTRAGDLVGTPQYMAPEQIRGESVDGRADVYALGAILYETVTGRLVFDGPSLMAILSRHLLDVPEPPSRRRPELAIPPAFDELVADMLRKDPRERLASMELAGERIAQLAGQLGGFATPVPTPPPGTGSHAALPTPGRAMRPPGVPQTYPPGMMHAPPSGAAAPHTPPPPGPPPMLPAPMLPPPQARPAPAAKKSSNTIWIVLAVIGAIAVSLAIISVASKEKKEEDAAGSSPGAGGGTTVPVEQPPAPGGDTPAAQGLGGDEVRLGNYRIVLPLGFIPEPGAADELTDLPAGADAQVYTGTISGNLVRLIAIATGEDLSYVPQGDLDAGCRELAQSYFGGGTLSDSRPVTGHGFQRYRCTVTGPAMSAEGAFYSGPTGSLILFFATDPPTFGGLRGARDELFDRRVLAP